MDRTCRSRGNEVGFGIFVANDWHGWLERCLTWCKCLYFFHISKLFSQFYVLICRRKNSDNKNSMLDNAWYDRTFFYEKNILIDNVLLKGIVSLTLRRQHSIVLKSALPNNYPQCLRITGRGSPLITATCWSSATFMIRVIKL